MLVGQLTHLGLEVLSFSSFPLLNVIHFIFVGFETKHPCKEGLGVCLTPPELKKSSSDAQRDLWDLGKEFVSLFLPKNFLSNYPRYCVFASMMTEAKHGVPTHRDWKNCAPEYHLVCGDFQGASLECFSPDNKSSQSFDQPYSVLKFDPRLFHRVVFKDFKGVRFGFALYIANHYRDEPVFYPPTYIN